MQHGLMVISGYIRRMRIIRCALLRTFSLTLGTYRRVGQARTYETLTPTISKYVAGDVRGVRFLSLGYQWYLERTSSVSELMCGATSSSTSSSGSSSNPYGSMRLVFRKNVPSALKKAKFDLIRSACGLLHIHKRRN